LATLSLEQVTKVFANGVEAVSEFDLFVEEGEFVVLVGPSGCGKTTLLRMVAGLEELTSGTIRLGGQIVNDVSARDRDVAMVFQNYALYPHLNVLDNIAFSLRVRGVPKHQRHPKAREAVFLMDEPLPNLDANLRVQMRSEVLRVQRRLGVAALYVTHDQTEAMTMGDRVAVLRGGTLQQLATPQELYENPANLFVASFIGSPPMNLYEGEISGSADRLVLSLGSQKLALPAESGHRHRVLEAGRGRKLVAGIRPEDLTVADGETADQQATLTALVELVELLGNESLVHFSTDATRVRNNTGGAWTPDATAHGEIVGASAAEGVARIDPRVPVATGDRVALVVDVERIHFFDAETGATIGATDQSPTAPQQPS
jgi:multiple sugar transport system ATP-binding protein